MSQQRNLPPNNETQLKAYSKRLHDDTKSMVDNFVEIMRLAKEEPQLPKSAQSEQDRYEMQVRAANIVRAGESLLRLISDMKQFFILNVFPLVNEVITQKTQVYKRKEQDVDGKLMKLRDELTAALYEIEHEYYSSTYK